MENKSLSLKNEALITAILNKNLQQANQALQDGASANFYTKEGLTPLCLAVKNSHFELIILLIRNQADINAVCINSGAFSTALNYIENSVNTDVQFKILGLLLRNRKPIDEAFIDSYLNLYNIYKLYHPEDRQNFFLNVTAALTGAASTVFNVISPKEYKQAVLNEPSKLDNSGEHALLLGVRSAAQFDLLRKLSEPKHDLRQKLYEELKINLESLVILQTLKILKNKEEFYIQAVIENILEKLTALKDKHEFCIPTSWRIGNGCGHAIYVHFIKHKEGLRIRIDNLNQNESAFHPHNSDRSLISPKIIGFIKKEDIDTAGRKYLEKLIKINALDQPIEVAIPSIYNLGDNRIVEILEDNNISLPYFKIQQYSNCWARNHTPGYVIRLGEKDEFGSLYQKLIRYEVEYVELTDFSKINANSFYSEQQKLNEQIINTQDRIRRGLNQNYLQQKEFKLSFGKRQHLLSTHYINLEITKEQESKEQGTKKTILGIHEIFQKMSNEPEPKKVLIIGPPGIGKTILSQMIAVEWGEGRLWADKFQAVFWIKLRDLQRHSNLSLIEILSKICVATNKTKEINQLVRDRVNHRCLMLLDGYDEVVDSLNPKIQALLEELLREDYIILTSRPLFKTSVNLLQARGFSRILDIKGFNDENVQTYIQRFISEERQATEIFLQLKRTPHLFSLAHIPIQLELILNLWEQEKGMMLSEQSTTEIYLKLTDKLGTHYMQNHFDSLKVFYSEKTIGKNPIAVAKCIMQKVACEAFQQQEIYIKEQSIENAIKYEVHDDDDQYWLLIKGLIINSGLLRRYQEGESSYFCFLHLTFQEFFTAQLLANQISKPCSTYIKTHQNIHKILAENKLDRRWLEVWSFTAGLLLNNPHSHGLQVYFDMLLDEPSDLSGNYQGVLLARCLNEAKVSDMIAQKESLLETLTYLALEESCKTCYVVGSLRLLEAYKVSLFLSKITVVTEALQQKRELRTLVKFIRATEALNTENILFLINLLEHKDESKEDFFHDEDMGISYTLKTLAAKANQHQRSLIVQPLLNMLRNKASFIRKRAAKTLHKISSYLEEEEIKIVFSHLIKVIDDVEPAVREYAISAMANPNIGKREKPILIHVLLKAVRDLDSDLQLTAARSLCSFINLVEKPERDLILETIISFKKDESFSQRLFVGVLAKFMISTDETERAFAIQELFRMLGKPYIRSEVALILGSFGGKFCELRESNRMTFIHSIKMQKSIQKADNVSQKERKVILQLLIEAAWEDDDLDLKEGAILALGNLETGIEEGEVLLVTQLIIEILQSDTPFQKKSCLKALGRLAKIAAENEKNLIVQMLIEKIKTYDCNSLWAKSMKALKKLGETVGEDERALIIQTLVKMLDDPRYPQKENVISILQAYIHNMTEKERRLILPSLLKRIKLKEHEQEGINSKTLKLLEQLAEKIGQKEVTQMITVLLEVLEESKELNEIMYVLNNLIGKSQKQERKIIMQRLLSKFKHESKSIGVAIGLALTANHDDATPEEKMLIARILLKSGNQWAFNRINPDEVIRIFLDLGQLPRISDYESCYIIKSEDPSSVSNLFCILEGPKKYFAKISLEETMWIEKALQPETPFAHIKRSRISHENLMIKLTQDLDVDYQEVFSGSVVEETFVRLAGITTNQANAQFRTNEAEGITSFKLYFSSQKERDHWLYFIQRTFPALIKKYDALLNSLSSCMFYLDTRKLYTEVSPKLGDFRKTEL